MSQFHAEQVAKYIRFFRQKRSVQVQEIQELFNDARDARVDGESLLGPEEVSDLLQGLCDSVKASFEEDLRRTVNMSVLAIQQLFEDADAQDLELQMDTSKIEDSHLIEEVEKMRVDGAAAASKSDKKKGRLVSLRDEQQRIVDQNTKLEEQVRGLRRDNEALQDGRDRNNNQMSNLTYEVESLRKQLEAATGAGIVHSKQRVEEGKASDASPVEGTTGGKAGNVVSLQEDLDSERDAIVKLRAELADARELVLQEHGIDIDDVVNSFRNSKQFAQMRKTLSQKSEQLTDLRRRLITYEPDQTALASDTGPRQRKELHK